MTLDHRDAILQRHVPMAMVPRYGTFEPLAAPGHRFLAASDGIWVEVRRPWVYIRRNIGHAEIPLPYGDIGELIEYAFDAHAVDLVQTRFQHDAERSMPNECAAWGVWNASTKRLDYRLLEASEASPTGVRFDRPALAENEHLVLDLHSHGALPAGFSATDDEDDAGEVKIASVYGGIGSEQPGWATRLCALGVFIEADPE